MSSPDIFDDLHIMRKNVNYMFNLLCARCGCNDTHLFIHILKYLQTLLYANRINGRLYTREDQTDQSMLNTHITYIKSLIQKRPEMLDICNEFNIMTIIAIEAISMLLQHELTQLHIPF